MQHISQCTSLSLLIGSIFSQLKVQVFVWYLLSGHQCADNFPATEVEERCPKDPTADEQQVRRGAVDCQCPSGEYHVFATAGRINVSTRAVDGLGKISSDY